jgi:AraC-like DNA-binding protein
MGKQRPPRQPLMLFGPYGPFIHWGAHYRFNSNLVSYRPADCYSLWLIEDGFAELAEAGKPRRLDLPAALLLEPRADAHVRIPAGSSWYTLRFDAVHVPRKRGVYGRTFVHLRPQDQPGMREVWGVELPRLVPRELLSFCGRTIRHCCALWWQSDLDHLRADLCLSQWLIEYVSWAQGRGAFEGEDWVARGEHLARQHLESGVGVKEMAESSGFSYANFVRRYKAERGHLPREFLLRLRMEKARHLLQATTRPVREIAKLCGYQSCSAFHHQFRREMQLTPLGWRRERI